jgi:flavin reductase (DIM6/NTAB) family NADH-FMN oxidoreductase RutF
MEVLMNQVKLKNNVFIPMPVTLVGSVVNAKPNFMAVGWVTRVNANPPMIAVGIGKSHYTPAGIIENKEFSICFPSVAMATKADYCGLVSGDKVDKAALFQVFYGEQTKAPMIEECPFNIECKLIQTVEFPTNYLFIGEIVGAYADKKFNEANGLDFKAMDLFFLTMPDLQYWSMGDNIGKAWDLGKGLMK